MSWRIPNHYLVPSNADDDKAFAKKGTRDKNPSEDRVKSKPQRWFWEPIIDVWNSIPSYPGTYSTGCVEERTQKWSDWDVYAEPFVPSYH